MKLRRGLKLLNYDIIKDNDCVYSEFYEFTKKTNFIKRLLKEKILGFNIKFTINIEDIITLFMCIKPLNDKYFLIEAEFACDGKYKEYFKKTYTRYKIFDIVNSKIYFERCKTLTKFDKNLEKLSKKKIIY
jgi:hypothetical protein